MPNNRILGGSDRGGWYHPHFLQGRPSELALITRTAIKKKNAADDAPSSANQVHRKTPNFYEMRAIEQDPMEDFSITILNSELDIRPSSNGGKSDGSEKERIIDSVDGMFHQSTNESLKNVANTNMPVRRGDLWHDCASLVQTLPQCSSAPNESPHPNSLAIALRALPHSMLTTSRHEHALAASYIAPNIFQPTSTGIESYHALQNLYFQPHLMNQSNNHGYSDFSTIQQPWHDHQSGIEYNSFQNSILQTSMMLQAQTEDYYPSNTHPNQARGHCHYGAEFQMLHSEQSSAHPNQEQYRMGRTEYEYMDSTTLNSNQQTHQLTQIPSNGLGYTPSTSQDENISTCYKSIPVAEAQVSTPNSIQDTLLINLGCHNALPPNDNEVGTTSSMPGLGRNRNNSVCNSTNVFGQAQRDECSLAQNYCTPNTPALIHQIHGPPQHASPTQSQSVRVGNGETSNSQHDLPSRSDHNAPPDDTEFHQFLIDILPCFEWDHSLGYDSC
eukprot:scaffold1129_cov28-Cyclotella_meneghiniana.AAC.1